MTDFLPVQKHEEEIKRLKEFLKTHAPEMYEVYHNKSNNFVSIKHNGFWDTYNGVTIEQFEKYREECEPK